MSECNKIWNNYAKRFIPRTRGRNGHTFTFGTKLSKGRQASISKQAEVRVRQSGKKLCRKLLDEWKRGEE